MGLQLRRLGASDLSITPIGLGTWAIGGGDWFLGWGPQDAIDSIRTIRRAIDRGVNWIDTAAIFGLGHAETVIARALRGVRRDHLPHLFTRCGLVWDDLGNVAHDLTAPSIRSQAEASLRRLNIERIDLFQLGWPQWPAHQPGHVAGTIDEAWEAMAELQSEGKVRHIGIASCVGPNLVRLHRASPVTTVSVPYSLLRREIEAQALPFCEANGIGVLACSTLGSGLLTGTMTEPRIGALPCNDWRRRHQFYQEMARGGVAPIVGRLRTVAARHGTTPGAIAIAWTLRSSAVTAAIVGARRPPQVDEMVSAAAITLSRADLAELGPWRPDPSGWKAEPSAFAEVTEERH
jgi:aryl-alcohol dehydrogenase-like predicted oxidoreductase